MDRGILVAASLLALLAGCGGHTSPADQPAIASDAAGAKPMIDPQNAGLVAPADAQLPGVNPNPPAMTAPVFAQTAASSDAFEIASSKPAQALGKSNAVKAFAAMMIADHTKSTDQLKAAAAKAGVTVTSELTSQQQADMSDLMNAGAAFDRIYGRKQLVAHVNALAGLRKYAAAGDSPPLKEFAAAAIPVVERHLSAARQLPK
ncbi:MAG: DUF4142 domain-containing protein [Novosphingobium sp.]|nr:DUF4142 domain-containing protein [Novosphingobium sp.]